jgi:hypothetical protein
MGRRSSRKVGRGGVVNLCSTCGRDFGSLSAFDLNRVGAYARSRRCLSERELRQHGYAPNRYGRWTIVSEAERARSRFPAAWVVREAPPTHEVASDASEPELANPRTLSPEQIRALAGAMLAVLEDDGMSPLDDLVWRKMLSER